MLDAEEVSDFEQVNDLLGIGTPPARKKTGGNVRRGRRADYEWETMLVDVMIDLSENGLPDKQDDFLEADPRLVHREQRRWQGAGRQHGPEALRADLVAPAGPALKNETEGCDHAVLGVSSLECTSFGRALNMLATALTPSRKGVSIRWA